MAHLRWSFDSVVLAAVAVDLEPLIGWVAGRVLQPGRDEILITLHPQGVLRRVEQRHILLSIHPRWARVHLSAAAEGGTPSGFCLLLRGRIEGRPLVRIDQPAFERTITLTFQTPDGEVDVVAEVMGRHSNLIAVRAGEVIGSLKTVPARMSVRPILPGHVYTSPPRDRPTPLELTADELRERLVAVSGPLARRVAGSVLGISPLMAAELVARAAHSSSPDAPIPDDDAAALWPVLQDLVHRVRARRFEPVLYRIDGAPVGFAPFPFVHLTGLTAKPQATMSAAVDAVAGPAVPASTVETERRTLQTAVGTALAKLARTEAELAGALSEAEDSDDLRQRGELLFAYGSQIPPRASEATVPGFDGRPVTIQLDPTLTPAENARRLLKRYARIRSAVPEVTRRLAEVRAQRGYLESVQVMLGTADTVGDLAAVRDELIGEGVLAARRRRAVAAGRSGPRRYTTASGHEVLVGRSNLENDKVTFTFGRPDDLWFHARGMPGAHVVLRSSGRAVPENAIREAAQIAAHFSSGRGAGRVPVSYTLRKDVKKPRRAKPGLVTIRNEQTVMVEPKLPETVETRRRGNTETN